MLRIKKGVIVFFLLALFTLSLNISNEPGFITQTQKIEMDQYLEQPENIDLFGVIEIPKINLQNPIYKENDPKNNVDQNVTLLEENITTTEENFSIVLASHSGNGTHAYFRNLEQLEIGDKIYLKQQNKTYQYEYFKKIEVDKTGTIYVENYSFPHIILITCSKTKKDKQEVYYAKLVENSPFLLKNN